MHSERGCSSTIFRAQSTVQIYGAQYGIDTEQMADVCCMKACLQSAMDTGQSLQQIHISLKQSELHSMHQLLHKTAYQWASLEHLSSGSETDFSCLKTVKQSRQLKFQASDLPVS